MCFYIGCVAAGPQKVYGVCNAGYIYTLTQNKYNILILF